MARLPTPGEDVNVWGDVLNGFLSVEHNADGTLKRGADIDAAQQAAQTALDNAAAASSAAGTAQTNAQAYADNQVASTPGFITYDTVTTSYPSRTAASTSTSRVVIWIGPVAPPVGGTGAVDGIDVWWRTP